MGSVLCSQGKASSPVGEEFKQWGKEKGGFGLCQMETAMQAVLESIWWVNKRPKGLRKFTIRCDTTVLMGECKRQSEAEAGEKERVLIFTIKKHLPIISSRKRKWISTKTGRRDLDDGWYLQKVEGRACNCYRSLLQNCYRMIWVGTPCHGRKQF